MCDDEVVFDSAVVYSSISRLLLVFELALCGTGYIQIDPDTSLARIEVGWGDGP